MLSSISPGLRSYTPLEMGARERPGVGQSQASPAPQQLHALSPSHKNTHQSGSPGRRPLGKGAGDCPSDPKTRARGAGCVLRQEPLPLLRVRLQPQEEEEPPSSHEPPRPAKRPRRELGEQRHQEGRGGALALDLWPLSLLVSTRRSQYVGHMKKEHGKVRGCPLGEPGGCPGVGLCGSGDGVPDGSLALRSPTPAALLVGEVSLPPV